MRGRGPTSEIAGSSYAAMSSLALAIQSWAQGPAPNTREPDICARGAIARARATIELANFKLLSWPKAVIVVVVVVGSVVMIKGKVAAGEACTPPNCAATNGSSSSGSGSGSGGRGKA